MILAKTIKGYGMGESGEAQNITHQQKKMSVESIRRFRDRFQIPVPDDKLDEMPFVKFPPRARPSSNTCRRGGWSSAAICPRAGARPTRSPVPGARRRSSAS